MLMNKSYIFAITLIVLIGIQLYQPTSAQSPSTTATNNGTSNELENATGANEVTDTIVTAIFESNLPALFIIVIFLVIIIPLVFDMYIVYKRSPHGRPAKGEVRQGMPGLYRSLMCFGVILLVGTVIFYLLALITLNINNTESTVIQSLIDLLKNLGTILGTALATIIAFYFGVRGAESAFTTGSEATTGGETKTTGGETIKAHQERYGVKTDDEIDKEFDKQLADPKPTGGETKPTEDVKDD